MNEAIKEIAPAPASNVSAKPESTAGDLQAKHDDLKERYDDLLLSAKELADQAQTLDAIKIGDTEVAKEMNRLRAQVRSLEEVRDRLMTTNAEQVRQIKASKRPSPNWKRRLPNRRRSLRRNSDAATAPVSTRQH